MLDAQPIRQRDAKEYIRAHHRHLRPPVGWLFGISAVDESGGIVGVATVSRPVARHLDDGWTAEVSRCCTDGKRNACSFLYRRCWRAAKAIGYRRLITYTLEAEGGASLRGAGFVVLGSRGGGNWGRPSRPRCPAEAPQTKLLWEIKDD